MAKGPHAAWRRILHALVTTPGSTSRELAATTGLGVETVLPYLSLLSAGPDEHRVVRRGAGGDYYATVGHDAIDGAPSMAELLRQTRAARGGRVMAKAGDGSGGRHA
jgi:hypothetical protein